LSNTPKQYQHRNWYTLHRQQASEYARKFRLEHPEIVHARKKRYDAINQDKTKKYRLMYLSLWPERRKEQKRISKENLRRSIFNIIGSKCAKCGFADIRALQFDHINGDGYLDRKSGLVEKSLVIYKNNPELAKKKLQTLCANCNQIKKHMKNETGRH